MEIYQLLLKRVIMLTNEYMKLSEEMEELKKSIKEESFLYEHRIKNIRKKNPHMKIV